jgi:quinol monooxygenase YgiN
MIVISGTVQVQPPLRAEAIAKAVWMQQLSQAEPGCRCYRFYTDLEDPNCFRIFEEWESEEALKAHFQTPHMA